VGGRKAALYLREQTGYKINNFTLFEEGKMPKQPGLDVRHRDKDGEIHHKMGNTKIGTLRETYGDDFAKGHRSDMNLENLLKDAGAKSLTDFRKNCDK
jgi:hypothetical protein